MPYEQFIGTKCRQYRVPFSPSALHTKCHSIKVPLIKNDIQTRCFLIRAPFVQAAIHIQYRSYLFTFIQNTVGPKCYCAVPVAQSALHTKCSTHQVQQRHVPFVQSDVHRDHCESTVMFMHQFVLTRCHSCAVPSVQRAVHLQCRSYRAPFMQILFRWSATKHTSWIL